jgi:hypothetical protein
MIGDVPIISFDTSAINRLATDGPLSEPILAGLKSGLSYRFVGLSIEEIVATSNPSKRASLFTYCSRLDEGTAECIHAHNQLLKPMIEEHFKNPSTFNWKVVDVKAREYERAIRTRELVDDEETSSLQKVELKRQQREYEMMWANIRPDLEEALKRNGETPPATFREAVARLRTEGSLIWKLGKMLYDPGVNTDASEATITGFMEACAPFRAVIYAMLMSWYNLAFRDEAGEKFEAGRNDLLMAVHLPYCDKFVTAEIYREQEKCLREIVIVAGLETTILSYDDFCDSFLVTV